MPTLGNALDFAKYEGRNLRAHQLGTAPSSPVTGQLYYNTADNTLYWWNGTTWVAASAGAGGPPTGAAGGDLTGTYPNPQIAAGVILDADVNGSAAIAESKLALATDAAAATGSRRTIGTGALQAMAGNRSLDSITAPAADVALNAKKITGLADGISATDAATVGQVAASAQGLDAKQSVLVASTANLGLTGLAAIDGVTPIAGDRVLAKDQTTPAQNGIYTAASGAWTRATDTDAWAELPNAYVWVERGTAGADTGWVCTVDQGGTIGSTAVTWVQFSGAGQITAGAGLAKTGNTLNVGAGNGITVGADDVGITNGGIVDAMIAAGNLDPAKLMSAVAIAQGGTGQTTAKAARETGLGAAGHYTTATHGAGATISITQATHLLRSNRGIMVQVRDEATGAWELPDHVVAANGDVTITFGASVSANSKRVILVG